MIKLSKVPTPPPLKNWTFIRDFQKYVLPPPLAGHGQAVPDGRVSLTKGINLGNYPDDLEGLLETALADWRRSLKTWNIPANRGLPASFFLNRNLPTEAYSIECNAKQVLIRSADLEGARRAIYFLLDQIQSSQDGSLPLHSWHWQPHIHTRITRCFYGPKKRPPVPVEQLQHRPDFNKIISENPEYRDELTDGRDYFPEAYLSRLAHNGMNAVWLTGYFSELCKSKIIPEYGADSEKRLARLRQIVERCRRFGIKVFVFCLEPGGFGERIPLKILDAHPELKGNYAGEFAFFCSSTEAGRNWLEEATFGLFERVPHLGGLLNLCVGERPTNCCSGYTLPEYPNHCPRCSLRNPAEVVGELLEIIQKAMNRANPDAQLIAWPYSQYLLWGEENTSKAVEAIPKNVTLIHNFESRGRFLQLGKERILDDYWLAYAGTSQLFRDCAKTAIKCKTRFGAKIQTCCSYELATVPYIPVPGILYQKYRAMRQLQVHTVMQSWLIGSCPSLMTRAAGRLSFNPFPRSEQAFLQELAVRDWGQYAPVVVKAWKSFQRGYQNYPYARVFSYYSPMNAGVVWPLFLEPRDTPLYPPFRANCPPCGDRIGECLMDEFTLEEAITLCRKMTSAWACGLALLNALRRFFLHDKERMLDIGVANAIGIQLKSCLHILQFYQLRENLAWEASFQRKRLLLKKLQRLVELEIEQTHELCQLAEYDKRLGFQADSECHIYFPAKLRWRIRQLKQLLKREFQPVRKKLSMEQEPFPEYTGQKPGSLYAACPQVHSPVDIHSPCWKKLSLQYCEKQSMPGGQETDFLKERLTSWQACCSNEALRVKVTCLEPDMKSLCPDWVLPQYQLADYVELVVEKQRLWSPQKFVISAGGAQLYVKQETSRNYAWHAEVSRGKDSWMALFSIPWQVFGLQNPPERPFRINLKRSFPETRIPGQALISWGGFHPVQHRLLQQNDDPHDFGWLFFQ